MWGCHEIPDPLTNIPLPSHENLPGSLPGNSAAALLAELQISLNATQRPPPTAPCRRPEEGPSAVAEALARGEFSSVAAAWRAARLRAAAPAMTSSGQDGSGRSGRRQAPARPARSRQRALSRRGRAARPEPVGHSPRPEPAAVEHVEAIPAGDDLAVEEASAVEDVEAAVPAAHQLAVVAARGRRCTGAHRPEGSARLKRPVRNPMVEEPPMGSVVPWPVISSRTTFKLVLCRRSLFPPLVHTSARVKGFAVR